MSSILPLHRLSEVAYKRPKKTLTDTLQDEEVIQRINETIEKITLESFDKLNYFKLKQLNENL